MKVLLFTGGGDSYSTCFEDAFIENSVETRIINYMRFLPMVFHKTDVRVGVFPHVIRNHYRNYYLEKIQVKYRNEIENESPDLILVYNDQMLTRQTAQWIRERRIKLAVFLADSAFFLHRRIHIMGLLQYADHIFAPDTFWLHQLNLLGHKNTSFAVPGYSPRISHPIEPGEEDKRKYSSDLVFIGAQYHDVWGYKRAMFLNAFADLDIKIYGPGKWRRWLDDFPALTDKIAPYEKRFSNEEVNRIINCCKIYPVDANPGSINGIHIRTFDAIGAGILPLVEYKKDLALVFGNSALPVIESYDKAHGTARHYLKSDSNRERTVKELRDLVHSKFMPLHLGKKILETIF
jgi:hypothetical protein